MTLHSAADATVGTYPHAATVARISQSPILLMTSRGIAAGSALRSEVFGGALNILRHFEPCLRQDEQAEFVSCANGSPSKIQQGRCIAAVLYFATHDTGDPPFVRTPPAAQSLGR